MKPRLNYEILRKGGAHDDKRRKYGFDPDPFDPFEWIDDLELDDDEEREGDEDD